MSNAFNINYDYGPVPTIRRFAQSDAFIRALVGPVGGGKSSGSIVEFVRRAQAQPRSHDGIRHSRWGVVRNCFDDQTEILTELRGWQLFKDLWASDKVATLNDGALTFETPSSYYTAPYTGEMIGFETQSADFLVTPNHHLWVSKRETRQKVWSAFQHEKACDTYGNALRRFKRDATWRGANARYDEAFFKFLGFWFAEGYAGAYEYPDRKEPHYRFTVVQKEGLEEVRDIIRGAGLGWGEHVNSDSGSTYFRMKITPDLKPLVAELAALGKATVKRLPIWIKGAPRAHLHAFLNGWLLGDGLADPDKPIIGFTSSRHLADDLQEIALKAGHVATITKRVPQQSPSALERGIKSNSEFVYTLTFAAPSRRSPVSRGRWYKQQYAGIVYCVEVSTHVVYVRRSGKAMWSGQTYAELRDTTLKSIFQWMPPQYFGHYAESRHSYQIKAFPGVDMELLFIALDRPDDVKKLLSLELTGGFVNEAREVPWAAIDLMQSRLGRFPRKADVSVPFWYGMWMDTNPPDADSKFYRFFEEEKHPATFAEIFKQPGGMTSAAENLANLPEGYYQKLAIGKSAEWIKIYIDGKYGFLVEGKLVYPEYNDAVHCKAVDPIEGVTIIRSWDFGLTPCCIFSQMLPDGRWLTFDEMTSDNMSIDKFSDDVLDHCTRAFRGSSVRFEDWGDPAGQQRAQTDSRTCFEIMINKGIDIEGSVQDPTLRQESVRKVLRTPGPDWEGAFVLHPRCKVLRKGFLGGYQRRRMQTPGPERYSDEPNKNEYSHPHDALQYAMVKYFGGALLGDDVQEDDFGFHGDYGVEAERDPSTGY